MKTFTFLWRVEEDGSFFEQDWQATTLAKAKRRWRNFWGLRQRDCVVFEVVFAIE